MRNVLLITLVCLLAAGGGYFAYRFVAAPESSEPGPVMAGRPQSAVVGTTAAAVSLPDIDGTTRTFGEWRGKLLLVNFWATWCTPCLKEIPLLVAAQDRYGARGFQVVGPAVDDPAAVKSYLPRLKIQYPVLVGQEGTTRAMDALGDTLGALPYSVLIDPQGVIVATRHGEFSADELDALVEQHLP